MFLNEPLFKYESVPYVFTEDIKGIEEILINEGHQYLIRCYYGMVDHAVVHYPMSLPNEIEIIPATARVDIRGHVTPTRRWMGLFNGGSPNAQLSYIGAARYPGHQPNHNIGNIPGC